LGQVKYAFIETSGEISVFYYEEKEVKYGLPILPDLFNKKNKVISFDGIYACTFCGHIEEQKTGTAKCTVCKKEEWVEAIKTLRIT
jgi:uncharacterized membrane protein YcaP (DUF421 family)